MIIAVCDPKGIAIEAIKTILYHDKGLSDRISRIYEFWNMEQLLDATALFFPITAIPTIV